MNYFTETTAAGLKIYRSSDKKHLKTIPSVYEPIAKEFIEKCNTDKIRLSETERETLKTYDFQVGVFHFLKQLEVQEFYVFELVKNSKAISVRKVNQRNDISRFELVFENGVKLKINESLFLMCENKSEANLNY